MDAGKKGGKSTREQRAAQRKVSRMVEEEFKVEAERVMAEEKSGEKKMTTMTKSEKDERPQWAIEMMQALFRKQDELEEKLEDKLEKMLDKKFRGLLHGGHQRDLDVNELR